MTSVSSSMFTGLMSTISDKIHTSSSRSYAANQRRTRTEALIGYPEVPKVDPQVISGDVGLTVRVDGDRVDMIGMGISVDFSWSSSDDVVLLLQAGQPQEIARCRRWERSLAIVEVVL